MKSKKEKTINLEQIPADVQKVLAVQEYCKNIGGVGSELLREYRAIMKKYPEYFKKELEVINNRQ